MIANLSKSVNLSVLASAAGWAWPVALNGIFKPRGVNLLVAQGPDEFVNIIGSKRIHAAIVDMDSEKNNGLATIRIIRTDYPSVPCILLSRQISGQFLDKALQLNVFSVLGKPVDMNVLQQLLDRLFVKKYNSHVFAE